MPSNDIAGMPRIVDEDYLIRRIEAIERAQRELGPSLMLATADAIATAVKSQGVSSEASATVTIPCSGFYMRPTVSVVVPAGYTKVTMTVSSLVEAMNTTATAAYVETRLSYTNVPGLVIYPNRVIRADVITAAGDWTVARNSMVVYASVLTGQTIIVALEVANDGAADWTSSAIYSILDVTCAFSR